jgi:hypothetical protein
MITKLAFYDMDGTLMDTPMPDVGKEQWEEVKGEPYPHKGWWGRAESLDTDVFDIKPFPSLLSSLKQDNADPNIHTYLLTSRIERLRPAIMNLLSVNDIKLDGYLLKNDHRDKDQRIKDILKKYPDVEEIDIYDDRQKEFELLRGLKDDIGHQMKINIYKADTGKVTLLECITTFEFQMKSRLRKYL